jgi:hypothetical protein
MKHESHLYKGLSLMLFRPLVVLVRRTRFRSLLLDKGSKSNRSLGQSSKKKLPQQ